LALSLPLSVLLFVIRQGSAVAVALFSNLHPKPVISTEAARALASSAVEKPASLQPTPPSHKPWRKSVSGLPKINLRWLSYFPTAENCRPAVHVYHAIHHKLTTISPQPKPSFSQNTPQKHNKPAKTHPPPPPIIFPAKISA
jgi:hypothetical protein